MALIDVALLVGFLFAVGAFLVLEKHLLSVFFGVALLSNAANVFVLAMSGPPEGRRSPIIVEGISPGDSVDPLPQALILTAIVIGSGVLVYAIFLIHRLFQEHGTTDLTRIHADAGDAASSLEKHEEQEEGAQRERLKQRHVAADSPSGMSATRLGDAP